MNNYNIDFPGYAREIISRLADEGYDAYAVGGCIRDSILGRTPHDWDITTEAQPDEVLRIFAEGDNHVIGTAGIRHGTVMVKAGADVCEITTFRSDGDYKDHRRPDSVTFSKTVEEDLARRDFTMNAIAAKPDGDGVIIKDPFGGIADIGSRVIRTVGDPDMRFSEDALRILRAVRFSAELGFAVEHNTAEAALRLRDTLEYIAAERITTELWRTLSAPFVADAARSFAEIFEWIISDELPDRFLRYIGVTSDPYVRLALMLEHGSDGAVLLKRLRLSGDVIHRALCLVSITDMPERRRDVCMLMRKYSTLLPTVAEYLHILKLDGVFRNGLVGDDLIAESESIKADGVPYLLSQLQVKGGDVISHGIEPAKVGQVLEYLLAEVQEGRVPNEKEALLDAIPPEYKTK